MSSATHADGDKLARFQRALDAFVARLREDRMVQAAVLLGSLDEETIWRRDAIALWIIEQDGVSKRLRADGESVRLFRTLVEDGVNVHVELIPRSRFKRMVEGASRTAFRFNVFCRRRMIYCEDPLLRSWFEQADQAAARDRDREVLVATTWVIEAHRHARRLLEERGDVELAAQALLGAAHGLAAIEVVEHGEVFEGIVMHRALALAPERFRPIYVDLLAAPRDEAAVRVAFAKVGAELDQHAEGRLAPLTRYLAKARRLVPLTEIADHFAHSQLHPWHLEAACEWLVEAGRLEKLSVPFGLTKKSRVEVEEPAYLLDAE